MNQLSTEVIEVREPAMSIFSNIKSFENAQRMAQVLAQSNIVPQGYQNNLPNVIVAMELANRIGVSPFMVMQNLDIIAGKPSWSSTFIIAVLNSCGRFTQLRFKFSGEGESYGCTAYAQDLRTGDVLESPKVDWKMVKAEGWHAKKGSKWATMPDLMFHYRSASFFGRLYASDILKGMQSADEVFDVVSEKISDAVIDEEGERIKTFIQKAETVKDLKKLKTQLGSDKAEQFSFEFEDRENEIILQEELEKEQKKQQGNG